MDSNSNNNGNSPPARITISMDCEKNANGCCPVPISASEEKVTPTRFAKRHGGIFFALMNNLVLSMEMLMVTLLQKYGIVGQNAAVYGYGGVFLVSIPIFFYYEWKNCWSISGDGNGNGRSKSCFAGVWPLTDKEKRMNFFSVIGRSLLAPSSTILRYVALEYLTIGDTIVVSYSSPILVGVLAHFLLREKTGFVPLLTALLALFGVGVILRPPMLTGAQTFDHRTVVGLFFAVLAMVCGACTVIVTRKIRKVQFSIVMMFDGLLGMTLAMVTLIPEWTMQNCNDNGSGPGHGFVIPQGPTATLLVIALAIFSSSSVLCHVLSLKFETAEIVALIGTSSSVFAFLVQYAALGIIPDIYSIVGGSLIFLGIMIVSFRKYLMTLPTENEMRRFFFFLLF